eukprot:3477461-Rhodomonas_salina.1
MGTDTHTWAIPCWLSRPTPPVLNGLCARAPALESCSLGAPRVTSGPRLHHVTTACTTNPETSHHNSSARADTRRPEGSSARTEGEGGAWLRAVVAPYTKSVFPDVANRLCRTDRGDAFVPAGFCTCRVTSSVSGST